ncbi:hypothetical protein CHS0354_024067 [Potamilus streckersoni]|uniref:tRNA-2-methylthio-N(6)-dimethylallyladenosine synthase n=1 Tax=Potamilus streckersoni TaxID=2493646 RepID=A0AAE0RZS3_9BIVA|nr:hypothetical protein CHS0354_024067 [Potamilus streckersoni]
MLFFCGLLIAFGVRYVEGSEVKRTEEASAANALGQQGKPSTVAVAVKAINDVMRSESKKIDWKGIKRGDMFFSDDIIRTGENSFCLLSFIDGTMGKILEKTQVKIVLTRDKGASKMSEKSAVLDFGKFSFNVKNSPGEEFKFISPTSVASIKGTEGSYGAYEGGSFLAILEGKGELQSIDGNKVFVNAGQIGTVSKRQAVVRELTNEEIKYEKLDQIGVSEEKKQVETAKDEKDTEQSMPKEKPERIIIKIRDKNELSSIPQSMGVDLLPNKKGKAFIETYGCQMNFSDSEIVSGILSQMGYETSEVCDDADVIFLNTCSIRENAESKIWSRLNSLSYLKKRNPNLIVGVIGCMAERLKKEILAKEPLVDIVVGPDAYRSLPNLLDLAEMGQKGVNTLLSLEETYADISPIRKQGVSAFISIMRGCDNMCTFCVVPFTRGRERSRTSETILSELKKLEEDGVKEITLLGQNVNSYFDEKNQCGFSNLLNMVSEQVPQMRIRFTTSNPQDLTDEVIEVMATRKNVCSSLHLPVQSGSTRILQLMNRKYSREHYLELVSKLKKEVPGISLSTDIITGFCSETEKDHQDTLTLIKEVEFDYAYTFIYSERPNTLAARQLEDNVLLEEKTRRLNEIINTQREISLVKNKMLVGQTLSILIERESKRSEDMWMGRDEHNRVTVFKKKNGDNVGDEIDVLIQSVTSGTLIGVAI